MKLPRSTVAAVEATKHGRNALNSESILPSGSRYDQIQCGCVFKTTESIRYPPGKTAYCYCSGDCPFPGEYAYCECIPD